MPLDGNRDVSHLAPVEPRPVGSLGQNYPEFELERECVGSALDADGREWRIVPLTPFARVAVAARCMLSEVALRFGSLAFWTSTHVPTLPYPRFCHSPGCGSKT